MNELVDFNFRLAKNLTALMKEKHLTLSAVAKKNSINKTTLHNYMNGILPKNLLSIAKLAEFFDVSISDLLLGDIGEKKPLSKKDDLPINDGQYEVLLTIKKIKKL